MAPNESKLKELFQEVKGVGDGINYPLVNTLLRRYAQEMLSFTITDPVIDEFVVSFIQSMIDVCDVDKMGVVDIDAMLLHINEFDDNIRQLNLYRKRLMNA